MTYQLSDFPGIDPNHVAKLREIGLGSTDDLMRMWSNPAKHATLVERSGIEEQHFVRLAAMARLSRVKNVGLTYLQVLVAAGIDGPRSLFAYTPEALVKHLEEVTKTQNLTGPVPTMAEVGPWFPAPKPVAAAAQ